MFVPQVAPGDECEARAGFPWMIVDSCIQERCPSACGARCPVPAALGQPCPDFICEEGAYCAYDEEPGRCKAIPVQTTPCTPDDASWFCGPDQYCADPLGTRCERSSSGCTCQPRLEDGTDCSPSGFNRACRSSRCDASGQCVTPQYTLGATCLLNTGCDPGLFCDAGASDDPWAAGTCQPVHGEGGTCVYADGCDAGLICRTSGTCARPARGGEGCQPQQSWRFDCGIGLVCESGVCVAPPSTAGAPCSGICYGNGLVCSYDQWPGKCVPASAQVHCGFDQACGPGYICSNDYAEGTCSPEGIVGAQCAMGSECDSGICGDDLTCAEACPAG